MELQRTDSCHQLTIVCVKLCEVLGNGVGRCAARTDAGQPARLRRYACQQSSVKRGRCAPAWALRYAGDALYLVGALVALAAQRADTGV
jgi:hypothetical protein